MAKCAAAQNFDKALDGLQTVLDIAGFIPGLGDAMDAVNLGISIFRGNVLDSVFSAIAMIPGLVSAISTPLKTIFNAVGNSSSITKAVGTLSTLFGGASKISSKLSSISSGISKLANKIPSAIASLKNNFVIKSLIGKKNLDNIAAGVRKGINSLVTRASEVMNAVKKAVSKNIKEEAAAKSAGSLKMNLQFFAKNAGSLSFKTGKAGEKYLAQLVGGKSQQYLKTTLGRRFIDQLANGIGYESKVGYTSLTSFVKKQILKDAELIRLGQLKDAVWHFFRSDVTGKVGASKQVLEFLQKNGIKYIIHD